jgi:sugar phosphate isomerase/epimerase
MLALSSAWRSTPQGRGAAVFDPLFRLLSRLPFAGLELDGNVGAPALADVRPVLKRRETRIVAFRGPVGSPLVPLPGRPKSLSPWLSAPDPALRGAAIGAHRAALELASDLEVPLLSISLGAFDPDLSVGRVDRPLTDEEVKDLARAVRSGGPSRKRALDGARFSLDALLTRAAVLGVRVAVENPALPVELPSPEELHALLGEFQGAPLVYAHDTGAARLCKETGGAPGRELLDAARGLCALVFVSDARGKEMGLVPGRGEIDFAGLEKALPAAAPRVLVPRRSWTERDIEEAVERLGEAARGR